MKTLLQNTGILIVSLVLLLSCEKEFPDLDIPANNGYEPGTVTVTLQPALNASLLQESEIVPMTRAENLIRTRLINRFQTVIIKKTDHKWIVDTLIKGKIDPSINDSDWSPKIIDVYDTVALPKIQLNLRPGTYKAGFFLNAYAQDWNPAIRPGFVVSEKEDITPQDRLPHAYTYKIQQDKHYQDYGCTMLNEEPFAGWTSFTIHKNDTLQQTGPSPVQTLTLQRRATRFRYLLKDTMITVQFDGSPLDLQFNNTAYSFKSDFTVPKETPFCQGLNILGGGYYPADTICTSLTIFLSTYSTWFTSPKNQKKYQTVTPGNSTYRSYYILMDEYYPDGVQCELKNITLSGASGQFSFTYDGTISRKFRLNHISGIVFEPSPRGVAVNNGYQSIFYMEEDTKADAVGLFDPFFELNPKP